MTTDNVIEQEAQVVANVLEKLPDAINKINDLPNALAEVIKKSSEEASELNQLKENLKSLTDELQILKNRSEAEKDNSYDIQHNSELSILKSEKMTEILNIIKSPTGIKGKNTFKTEDLEDIKKSVNFIITEQNTKPYQKKYDSDLIAIYEKNRISKTFLYDLVTKRTDDTNKFGSSAGLQVEVKDFKNPVVIQEYNAENSLVKTTGALIGKKEESIGLQSFHASFDVSLNVMRRLRKGGYEIDPIAEQFARILEEKDYDLSKKILNGKLTYPSRLPVGHQGMINEANPQLASNRFLKDIPVPTYASKNYKIKIEDLTNLAATLKGEYLANAVMLLPDTVLHYFFHDVAADGHKTFDERFSYLGNELYLKTPTGLLKILVVSGISTLIDTLTNGNPDNDKLAFENEKKIGFEDYVSFTSSARTINELYDPNYSSTDANLTNYGKIFAIIANPSQSYTLALGDVSYLTQPTIDQHTTASKVAKGIYEYFSCGVPTNNRAYAVGYIRSDAV